MLANAYPFIPPMGYKPYPEMVEALFKTMGSDQATLMHAAIGIAGEASELIIAAKLKDRDNIIEEAGDAFFYTQKMLTHFGFNPLAFAVPQFEQFENDISLGDGPELAFSLEAGNVLDMIKKVWVYERDLDLVAMHIALGRLLYRFFEVLAEHNLDFEGVLEYNQIKLGKRYPNGVYSNADANARADKQEEGFQPAAMLELDPTHSKG